MHTTVHRWRNWVVVITVVNCRRRRSSELCLRWFSNFSVSAADGSPLTSIHSAVSLFRHPRCRDRSRYSGGELPHYRLHMVRVMQDRGYGLPRIHLLGTGVKIALVAPHFHAFGVARQGPWNTVEKLPWCSLSPQIGYQTRRFGAFQARFVVSISSTPTFSTG